MGSRVPEIIDALVTLARADPGLADVRVTDGPELTGDSDREWLVVGFDGDPEGDYEAAQTVGGWADLGGGGEEEFQIPVAALVMSGDTDVVALRRRAYAIADHVETWLHASPGLGLESVEAQIAGTQLVQDQTSRGARARLVLTVAGRAFTY
ncbi:hypothetical protein [Streptomyces sp. SID8352]|uniref:hypothetical protein n=1 Tax=Streptomyces sp. SID8352 TaxID=2690338 RepID=UPI00136E010A|nr:hypothetical protein [Streptomyces sp. SID8352]MYU24759.1 hypothetical protein [Streptomyces sp. SID8352]